MAQLVLPWDEQPGTPNNVNRVMDNDKAIRDRVNSQYGKYRTMQTAQAIFGPGAASGTPYMASVSGGIILSGAANFVGPAAFSLDPADFSGAVADPNLRIRVALFVNSTAPAVTFTFGLYPVASCGGVGTGALVTNLGTVITGSTVAVATPLASTQVTTFTSDFGPIIAGNYVFGALLSGGSIPANVLVAVGFSLLAKVV